MTATVRLFARLRELVGADTISVSVADGAGVESLRAEVASLYPSVAGLIARCAVAVNGEYATADRPLGAADEVALIPPVSGGC